MKTKVAYYIVVYWRPGSIVHEQYIFPNELHLIATFFKDNPNATHIEVQRHELSDDHWLFS